MLKSQELQIKMSAARNELNDMLSEEQPDLEKRSAKVAELQRTESDYQAALTLEAADTALHVAGEQTELSPLIELRDRVSVADYVTAALESRSIAGAALEYAQEMKYPVDGAHLPWELIAPVPEQRAVRIDGLEYRADVVTAPGVVNRRPGGRFLDRVMQGTFADYLGITMESVAVGEPIHTIMTAGTVASMVEAGDQQDAAAADFAIESLSPKRMTGRYVWRVEDVAKLSGLEAALQRDLSRVMAINMDNAILSGQSTAGATSDADIVGLNTAPNVKLVDIDFYNTAGNPAVANRVNVDEILQGFAGLLDAIYAEQLSDLRTLVGVNINQLATGTIMPGNNQFTTQLAVLRTAGLMWRPHPILGGAVANNHYADNAVVALGSRPMHRDGVAVQAVWPTVSLIRDPYTGAGRGEVALTALALWDFKVLRAESFYRVTTDNS